MSWAIFGTLGKLESLTFWRAP